jgi:hypothetical protein
MPKKKHKIPRQYIQAQSFVESWFKALKLRPAMAEDRNAMLNWFTDAITAGYDAGYDNASLHNREL